MPGQGSSGWGLKRIAAPRQGWQLKPRLGHRRIGRKQAHASRENKRIGARSLSEYGMTRCDQA